ncbi:MULTISPECIES: hypothetical protein [unclassified Microcystis]|jgi:hypothetical protein|uniref:hypothetical protein n=1 Tax=unclassified Microcystis TaxID=2643300 RepID=UPI0002D27EFC|nr:MULTISPECIES: hypothetical protein [unclassified Microcystis]MCA2548922.1 hypothetical protein [Microcystis sp. M53BS1]MCA2610374.1 hypothetical protein [Microcystis sp. M27BS1]NCS28423.1 hypothetical protein [Microcystis aeruginosa F13-15]MCA2544630.1 hypothetical protein [Microcystis sp. M55BS1]MCA2559980.1 hypothetical protein [Microcystis sp. M43BS1]
MGRFFSYQLSVISNQWGSGEIFQLSVISNQWGSGEIFQLSVISNQWGSGEKGEKADYNRLLISNWYS